MIVLGICGPAGSGKTTLARLLSRCGWQTTKFASGLKTMLASFLLFQKADIELVTRMLEGDLKETPSDYFNGKTPRHAMQVLGTEWRDLIDKNLWTEAWKRSLKTNRVFSPESKILVDDLRFHHEADAVRSLNGKIVFINRPGLENVAGQHLSETELWTIEPDLQIQNDSSPEKMLDQLRSLIRYS